MKVDFSIGKQDTHGVIDPELATASTLHTELGDVVLTSDSTKQRQEQRFDRYLADTTLAPAQNGRLDLTMDATVNGWKSASQISGGTPVAIGIQTMRGIGRIKGVNRDRVAALLAATGGLIGALPPDIATKEDKTDLPAPARAQLRLIVDSLQDMLTEVSLRGDGGRAAGRGRRHGRAVDAALPVWLRRRGA